MDEDVVVIPRHEYEELKKFKQVDKALLADIARGIKDILQGRVKEV